MNMTKTKNLKKNARKVTGNYTTIVTNVAKLANGSYLARKTRNGKRIGLCFTTIKAAKDWAKA